MVRAAGFEPARHNRGILSPLRLPFRHARVFPLGVEPRSKQL